MNNETMTHCGLIAIVGRPNVGKSTLLNDILGQKLSITSRRPQTTRHRLLGIKTEGSVQSLYVDTPGLSATTSKKKPLQRYMDHEARDVLQTVDVIAFVVEATRAHPDDEWLLEQLVALEKPLVLIINKTDTIKQKDGILPIVDAWQKKASFSEILPVCARSGKNVERLESVMSGLLPENPFFYPDDQLTDRSSRFLVAEFLREKLMRYLGQELPFATTVSIERFEETVTLVSIDCLIWVEREGQKAIVIGKQGERIKQMSTKARQDMEELLGKQVMLKSLVKVKSQWSDDQNALNELGYRRNSGE